MENKEDIKYWYKKLYNKYDIWDYDKIYNDEAFIFVIISERGRKGKTFNATIKAKQLFDDFGYTSVYMKNLEVQMDNSVENFLKEPRKHYPEMFEDCEITKNGVYEVKGEKKDRIKWLQFINLNQAEKIKGARDLPHMLIYDEMSDGTEYLREQTEKFKSILDTMSDAKTNGGLKKVVILSNFKTLDTELMRDFKVFTIDKEVSTIYDSEKKPLIRILLPQYTEDDRIEIKQELKGNPIFEIGELTETNRYSVYNESLYDVVNNVEKRDIKWFNECDKTLTIFDRGHYIKIFKHPSNIHHIVSLKKYKKADFERIYVMDKKEIFEGSVILNKQITRNFLHMMETGNITFQNIGSRNDFLTAITR